MLCLEHTFEQPEENLACDEVLLDQAEAGLIGPLLRFWEPSHFFVVAGYANKIEREVNLEACRERGWKVLRRCTGGGTVLQGPGCLNYSLILPISDDFASVTATNRSVMQANRAAVEFLLGRPVEVEGDTDLALDGRKFSGNAQRRRNRFLLFHGTFLLNFALEKMDEALSFPSRQPEYRGSRPHREFVRNLGISGQRLRQALKEKWKVTEMAVEAPKEEITSLVGTKYSQPEWNGKF